MGLIITLIVFVGLAAIIVWVADWTSVGERRSTGLDILNRRLARGEIDRAEYRSVNTAQFEPTARCSAKTNSSA
jgi:uncharacterized membrane protein